MLAKTVLTLAVNNCLGSLQQFYSDYSLQFLLSAQPYRGFQRGNTQWNLSAFHFASITSYIAKATGTTQETRWNKF
jgi:hypothetical protein